MEKRRFGGIMKIRNYGLIDNDDAPKIGIDWHTGVDKKQHSSVYPQTRRGIDYEVGKYLSIWLDFFGKSFFAEIELYKTGEIIPGKKDEEYIGRMGRAAKFCRDLGEECS
jgi:hypothetical protein